MTKDRNYRLAILAAIMTNFIFGLSFMASRIALEHTASSMVLMLRFGLSVVIMLLLILTKLVRFSLKDKPVHKLLLLGLFHPVIYFIGEANGIKYTNSSFAGVMISLIPVVTAIFSGIFLHERPPKSAYGWILCSVVGVAIISMAQTGGGAVRPVGILFLMIAVVAGSAFFVLSRSLSDEFSPFERTFVMMTMGFVFYAVAAIAQEGSGFMTLLTGAVSDRYVILPILYLSLISSVLGFILQNYSVTYLNAATVTAFANVVPVVSLLAGVLVLGEPFSAIYLLGIILILLGVYEVSSATNKE